MASVYRVTAIWSGFTGAPGYSKFSFSDLTTDAARNAAGAAIKAYFDGCKAYQQSGWSIGVQPLVQEYNVESGDLVGEATMTTVPSATVGTPASGPFAGGSGFCVTWKTSTIYGGRRTQGRTFHVPAVSCFDTDGTLSSSALIAIRAAADGLVAAPGIDFCIWARSWYINAEGKKQAIGGDLGPVTSAVVKDASSQLRTRRT